MMPDVCKNWNLNAFDPGQIEWVLSVDGNRPDTIETAKKIAKSGKVKVVVQDKEPFNCVRGWNLAAEQATGKVLVAVTDDFTPPQHWDAKLLALEPKGWEDGEHVVHIDDGFVRTLCTLSILTSKRYERFGYLFYPDYQSMFCDTEFTEVAYRDGVVIKAMHLLFEHLHPDCGKRLRDEADLKHASSERWRHGEILFNYRKFKGFPQDKGPKAVTVETKASGQRQYCAYMQVNRDDFCLAEVCLRLIDEGVRTFFWAIPDEYWTGEPTTQANLNELAAVKETVDKRLAEDGKGGVVHTKVFKVRNYRFTGDTRITVETRVRNDSLSWIRRNGFNDILIVDGDELWKPGLLKQIDEMVAQGAQTINAALIPVIGLPGYPVDRAQDTAVVYIGGNIRFSNCRTPEILPIKIFEPMLYHFTGTRRTMEEVIAKHKASGHYDDPDYDFEGWLANILPNVKPGLKDAHMYKPYQIWPAVRAFTPEEITGIPATLHRFLGA